MNLRKQRQPQPIWKSVQQDVQTPALLTTGEAGFDDLSRLAEIASMAVWAFAVVIAMDQIGIAAALVSTLSPRPVR